MADEAPENVTGAFRASQSRRSFMTEPIVRVSQGFFEPQILDSVIAHLREGRSTLEPALRTLHGLLHYYVSLDAVSSSMVNISVWETLADAKQMETLPEMLAQRDVFVGLGVKFQPIRNYSGLWSI
jgi:hypothetical protein